MTLDERARQLHSVKSEVRKRILNACRDATLRAIEKAAELTPPVGNDLSGTNTRTGELKAHWATDSEPEPKESGDSITTVLANDKNYASYVNDGHRMDRHFVPGLYVNPYSGLLEYDPSKDVGIVVGTKTSYVQGLHMTDEAVNEYRRVLKEGLATLGEVLG